MGLFDLIAQGIHYLTAWLPRPLLIVRTQRAVVWFLWFKPRVLYGLIGIIPLLEEHEVYDLRWDAEQFAPQTLWTKDAKDVALGLVVVWRVKDPLKAAESVNDLADMVEEVSESVLPELVAGFTLEELQRKVAGGEGREWSFNQHLTTRAGKLLERYGLEVDYARVNFTASRPRTFNLLD